MLVQVAGWEGADGEHKGARAPCGQEGSCLPVTTMPPDWALARNSGGRGSLELAIAIAMAEAMVLPYQIDAGLFLWRVVVVTEDVTSF